MRTFGIEPEECERTPRITYSEAARADARALLNAARVNDGEPVFIVCPGSVWPTKRWTIAGYAGLVRSLERDYSRVLLCGGPDDRPGGRAVQKKSGGHGGELARPAHLQTFLTHLDRPPVVV